MSHFVLAVITEDRVTDGDLEEILFPYSENREVEPRIDMTKKEVMDEQARLVDEAKNKPKSWANEEYTKGKFKLDLSYKEFVKLFHGEDSQLDPKGNLLTTYNPDSKWDWFVIGGRWKGLLCYNKNNGGMKTNQGRIKFIDWKKLNRPLKKDKDYWSRLWDIAVRGCIKTKLEVKKHKYIFVYKKEYYLKYYQNKEMFIKRNTEFKTHAVVTPDGKWHEKGEMGWFGVSHDKPKEAKKWDLGFYGRFIKPYLDTNYVITVVDCHI